MLTQLMIVITLLWAGMILGISFLESWAKFRAPSLTRAVGLDVGRTVFGYFHRVQVGLLLLMVVLGLSLFDSDPFEICSILIALGLIFCIQSVWFLPQLNERVRIIIAGETLPPSYVHMFYGVAELAKFALLCLLGVVLMPCVG